MTKQPDPAITGNARGALKGFVTQIEEFHDEQANLAASVAGVYRDAAEAGFDKKALRILIRLRAQDPAKRAEMEAIVEMYEAALR